MLRGRDLIDPMDFTLEEMTIKGGKIVYREGGLNDN